MRERGTDCFSRDGLVARALWLVVRTQMRTAQRGSIPITVVVDDSTHQGLVELARCRSDLSLCFFWLIACCAMDGVLRLTFRSAPGPVMMHRA